MGGNLPPVEAHSVIHRSHHILVIWLRTCPFLIGVTLVPALGLGGAITGHMRRMTSSGVARDIGACCMDIQSDTLSWAFAFWTLYVCYRTLV